jgi:hypothetical protein
MSVDHDPEARLRRDVESYLRGDQPSLVELACAPLLEDWSFDVIQLTGEAGGITLRGLLSGHVSGHPRLPDGSRIRASEPVWLDRNGRWARTWNRVYRLGDRADRETST